MRKRLGCVSVSGIIAAFIALLLVVGVSLLWGGMLFSPGPLNAQTSGATLGNVSSHAELGRRCSACHPAPWSRETMSERCLACHTEVARQLQEPSSLHGVLRAGSQNLLCYDCHPEHRGTDAPLTYVDVDAFPHEATGYALQGHQQTAAGNEFACADCHGQDLTSFDVATCADCHADLDAAYTQTHIEAFGPGCLACHDGIDTYGEQFDHDRLSFPLQGRHTSAGCAGCHEGARSIADLQAAPQDCFSCHAEDDAHDGQFGQDCAACHTPEEWEAATFDHAQTAFPLEGQHATVECRDCHVDGVYQGTPRDCFSCHAEDDAHEGQFGQDCAECHTPQDWGEAIFDHAQTAFPLLGQHATIECGDCHVDGVYQGTPQDCFSCHAEDDAHEGQFGQDCAECHTPQDWGEATFDHAQTAFPLLGQHATVECGDCHVDGVYQGTPQDCFSCHAADDAHEGQFGPDCAECHTPQDWGEATFDHAQTAFPLVGEHVNVECGDCHIDGIYRGTPQDCFSCHREDDAHEGQFGPDCAECHTPQDWGAVTFDHAQTAFPLTGAHIETECLKCHVGGVFTGTSQVCSACHDDPAFHLGLLGTDCAACHTTAAWSPARYDRQHTFPYNHGESGPSPCRTCHPDTLSAYTCYNCHEHNPAQIESEHREEGIADFQDCVRCHPTGRGEEGEGGGD